MYTDMLLEGDLSRHADTHEIVCGSVCLPAHTDFFPVFSPVLGKLSRAKLANPTKDRRIETRQS